MPKATFFPKQSPRDFKGAMRALCQLWFQEQLELSEREVRECESIVLRFIGRADQSAAAGGEADA